MSSVNANFKILIVDDEPLIVELLKDELEYTGYEVLVSSSGNEAIEILLNDPSIDLVLTDAKMPHGSGIELLKRKSEFACDSKIFMISGEPNVSITELVELGLNKFFAKPYKIEDLLDALEQEFKKAA